MKRRYEKTKLLSRYPSTRILNKAICDFFSGPHLFKTGISIHRWPNAPIIDVVLIGDAFAQLTDIVTWPDQSYFRIWVLSQSTKRLLLKFLPFLSQQIGVIPRDAIFPNIYNPPGVISLRRGCRFVLASRMNKEKNVDLSLKTLSYLQQRYANTSIAICGSTLRRRGGSAWPTLRDAVGRVDFQRPPEILGDLGTNWTKSFPKTKSVLLHLSTDYTEDFGVSVAQAQAAGIPCILSNHGAHTDTVGAMLIPKSVMGNHLSSPRSLSGRARKTARYIEENWRALFCKKKAKRGDTIRPNELSARELLKITSKLPPQLPLFFDDEKMFTLESNNPWAKSIVNILYGG